MPIWIKLVNYAEGIDNLDMVGSIEDSISTLVIAHAQDIRDNSYFVM